LVDETRALLARPLPLSRTAQQAVGYREVIEHLAGERDLQQTIELVKLRTRQFAKRQSTWFRSLSECQFVAMSRESDQRQVIEEILLRGLSGA
jgi:tRNA dimethylallyltransferase